MWLAGSAFDPAPLIAQWGVAGLILIVLFAVGRVIHKEDKERSDRLEAELREVNKALVDRVVPALTDAAKAIELAHDREIEARARRRA